MWCQYCRVYYRIAKHCSTAMSANVVGHPKRSGAYFLDGQAIRVGVFTSDGVRDTVGGKVRTVIPTGCSTVHFFLTEDLSAARTKCSGLTSKL